jgi:hypothetical protein
LIEFEGKNNSHQHNGDYHISQYDWIYSKCGLFAVFALYVAEVAYFAKYFIPVLDGQPNRLPIHGKPLRAWSLYG